MRGRGGARGGRAPSAPWSRLKPVEMDPLEAMGLPSKGDNRLLDFKTQERYYTKIVERYMAFCSDAGERDELLRRFAALRLTNNKETQLPSSAPPTSSSSASSKKTMLSNASSTPTATPSMSSTSLSPATTPSDTRALSDVLSALRKLREGIVASKRTDTFAVQAYLFCIRLAVLVKHPESYHPALLHLLRRIRGPDSGNSDVMTSIELAEAAGYLVLDTACRRGNLAEAYALRRRYRLADARVDGVLRALAHDNWVALARLRRRADGHRASLLEFAEERVRRHLLKCFARSYLSVDLGFLERSADRRWDALTAEDGVGWELEGDRVVIRKVRAR
ncbi:hypothetical protein DL762_007349 [Monosporascus cannonballus]|uniref:CSN8/PSMD8/EIF3K domain-containing protein n=1 Tax=Monosporascus cannonballus TaxID=155416 RepID=A0ABY0H0A0_9PEZI|nr:hypothetical protein DL762_007349 [Monosporascus cannonballus]